MHSLGTANKQGLLFWRAWQGILLTSYPLITEEAKGGWFRDVRGVLDVNNVSIIHTQNRQPSLLISQKNWYSIFFI